MPNQPNVVYILTDQWRAKATGYNGDPNAVTPNIDRLAADTLDGLESKLQRQLERIDDPFEAKEYYLDKWGYKVNETGEVPYSR